MRKIVIILTLATAMLFAFTACGKNADAAYTNRNAPGLPNQNIHQSDYPEATEQPVPEDDNGILQHFYNLGAGFSLTFPISWEDKFGFYAFDVEFDFGIRQYVEVYHIATREEDSVYPGTLFTLGTSPREVYTQDEPPIMAGATIILAQTGGITYFMSFPSSVVYNETYGSETAAEYLEMMQWERIEFIVDSFKFID